MSEFYARYIPPSTSSTQQSNLKRPNVSKPIQATKRRKTEDKPNGSDVLTKYKVTARVTDQSQVQKAKKSTQRGTIAGEETPPESRKQKQKANRKDETELDHDIAEDEDDLHNEQELAKHTKVLSRFSKAKSQVDQNRQGTDGDPIKNVHPNRVKFHDLAPIPQPELSVPTTDKPSYSTVPEWLEAPLKVDQNARQAFDKLKLPETVRKNLNSQNKTVALPIQSAVLPLLLDQPIEKRPDLCIAAATGSGKTFAYLLPIINALQGWQILQLQAVIIVPTRALVKQVVQTLRSCSTGLDLRIGTAEGSRPLAEERQQLLEEKWVYSPTEYEAQQSAPPDWGTFSLEDLLEDAEKYDLLEHIGHIREYRSKVNVLVCTPGRLVEHLQSTKGFNLDHVEWFVVDEADRLLNESYHEWLDVVLPALKSQGATAKVDKLLRQMKMDVPRRRVTKIMLSATMTSDISQLLALELNDPKMVVMEDAPVLATTEEIAQVDSDGGYQVPISLHESAIAFKDSENKPLYLLELLKNYIFAGHALDSHITNGFKSTKAVDEETSSDDSSESSDISTDSDDNNDSSSSDTDSSSDANEASSISSDTDTDSDSSPFSTSSSSRSRSPPSMKPKPLSPSKSSSKTPTLPRVLIFTKSTESAHRLSRLLSHLDPSLFPYIDTFTRSPPSTSTTPAHLPQKSRTKTLNSFTHPHGPIRILISTDLAARGLDIPNLEHVVNYDVPASALTYVHRVGRTARAGQEGQAWTLVEHKQGRWFWGVIGGKSGMGNSGDGVTGDGNVIRRGGKTVKKVTLTLDLEGWGQRYEEALRKLGEDVRGQS